MTEECASNGPQRGSVQAHGDSSSGSALKPIHETQKSSENLSYSAEATDPVELAENAENHAHETRPTAADARQNDGPPNGKGIKKISSAEASSEILAEFAFQSPCSSSSTGGVKDRSTTTQQTPWKEEPVKSQMEREGSQKEWSQNDSVSSSSYAGRPSPQGVVDMEEPIQGEPNQATSKAAAAAIEKSSTVRSPLTETISRAEKYMVKSNGIEDPEHTKLKKYEQAMEDVEGAENHHIDVDDDSSIDLERAVMPDDSEKCHDTSGNAGKNSSTEASTSPPPERPNIIPKQSSHRPPKDDTIIEEDSKCFSNSSMDDYSDRRRQLQTSKNSDHLSKSANDAASSDRRNQLCQMKDSDHLSKSADDNVIAPKKHFLRRPPSRQSSHCSSHSSGVSSTSGPTEKPRFFRRPPSRQSSRCSSQSSGVSSTSGRSGVFSIGGTMQKPKIRRNSSMKDLWKGIKNSLALTRKAPPDRRDIRQPPSSSSSQDKKALGPDGSTTSKDDTYLVEQQRHARGRPTRKTPARTRSKSLNAIRLRRMKTDEKITKEEFQELEKVALTLKENLTFTSRKDRLKQKTYLHCFSGSAAVDLLCKLLGSNRIQALQIGRAIVVHFQMFVSCHGNKNHYGGEDLTTFLKQRQQYLLQDSSNTFYRLLAYLPTEVRSMTIDDKMSIFEDGVSVKDRRQGLRKYKQCFVGKDAVTFLVSSRLTETRREAVELGRLFVRDYNMFEPVLRDSDFEDDSNFLYRFVEKRSRYFSINDFLSTRIVQIHGDSADLTRRYSRAIKTDDGDSSQAKSETGTSERSLKSEYSEVETEGDAAEPQEEDDESNIVHSKDYRHLCEIADILERGIKVGNRRVVGPTLKLSYKDTFIAARAVTFMVTSGLAHSREEAVAIGKRLEREFNLIHEVTGKHDFGDTNHYFCFTAKADRYNKPLKIEKPLEKVAEDFENGVKVKDYMYRLKAYKNSFVGSSAVDFLVNSRLAASRTEAVRIGRQLIEKYNLFERLTGDREFCDDQEFFRFVPRDERRTPEAEDLEQETGQQNCSALGLLTRSTASKHALVSKPIPEELLHLAESILNGIKVKENKFRAKSYPQTFVGSNVVSFMVNSSLAKSRKEAVELGKRLSKEVNLFRQVDGIQDFKDDYLLYRFEQRFEEAILKDQNIHPPGLIKGLSGFQSVSVKSLPLEKIAEVFRDNVKVGEHKGRVNRYKDTFIGREAVDFLVGSSLAESRVDAVDLGRSLAREFNLFEHVKKDHEFKDERLLYRFSYHGKICPMEELEIEMPRLMQIAKEFEQNIAVKDHQVRLRFFENTFVGSEAVDYLVESRIASTRKEAVQMGRAMTKELNLFEHVTNDRKFEDSSALYFFVKDAQRYKGLMFEKHGGRRNIFLHSDDELSSSEGGNESSENIDSQVEFEFQSEDTEWAAKMAKFEKKMQATFPVNEVQTDDSSTVAARKIRTNSFLKWASKFHRLDPRYQIQYFFDYVAQDGAQEVEDTDFNLDAFRTIFNFLPNRAQVFTVWRPTSLDAIRKMMLGEAVGKGLDIKGKSAKRGKLSGFVPFLQIGENKHKSKIRPPSKNGVVRVFYPGNARRARDIAAEKLERIAEEMMETVENAKKMLADNSASKEAEKDALDAMLLDMSDPVIRYIDAYAPKRYGFEIPERLFWEGYFARQDCTRKPGSEYDTGRPSQPAFQDMNFAAIRAPPKEDAPRAVIYQAADPESPMNPFELLVAYEENDRVMPVVSDFDCFLVGTKRVQFTSPLAPEQMQVLTWYMNEIEKVMEESVAGDCWTVQWLEVLKEAARQGFYPEMPRFGFGDPKSYSIMKNAVSRLSHSGAVRHGAECFNYYFPQDLDDEFLVIANDLPNNRPWAYVDLDGLQDILSKKIDQGFTFPLNPKWVLCDAYRWKELYDKLLCSEKEETKESMNIWFPPESGLREQIERIHNNRPDGFYQEPSTAAGLMVAKAASRFMKKLPKHGLRPPVKKENRMSTVLAVELLEKFQQQQREYQSGGESGESEDERSS